MHIKLTHMCIPHILLLMSRRYLVLITCHIYAIADGPQTYGMRCVTKVWGAICSQTSDGVFARTLPLVCRMHGMRSPHRKVVVASAHHCATRHPHILPV